MIAVIRENGDVHFFNEGEFIEIKYCKEFKQVVGYPIQRTAAIGMPLPQVEITDVVCVTFTNESQPTALTFQADKEPADFEKERIIDNLFNEIDRLDEEEKKRKREEHPHWRNIQKSGRAVRFANVCKANDIETVGQLLNVGRSQFERFFQMGKDCAEQVSRALENLYGIKTW